MLLLVFVRILARLTGEEAASGLDIFTARGAKCAGKMVAVEVVLKATDGVGIAGLEGCGRRGMETDEVDVARETAKEFEQLGSVGSRVVTSAKHSIFKSEVALTGPVVLAEEGHHIFDGVGALNRHDGATLFREGIVEADSEVALRLVEEFLQRGDDANGRECDAMGTPTKPPVSGEHFNGLKHLREIVERFTHAHKYHIGKRLAFRDGENLIDDLGSREIAVESLLSGDAEGAPHLASHLRGDAECGALSVGDIDGFDIMMACVARVFGGIGSHIEKVFLSPVDRGLALYRGHECSGGHSG